MTYQLGVDLGTTYSAAAIGRDGRVEACTLGTSNPVMPSVVLLRADGEVLQGELAVRRGLAEPTRVAREFKRRLGDPTPLVLGGTPYGAESLMGHLLRAIVATVSEREGEAPAHVVLTHPANYGPYKLDMMREVARLAGLDLDQVTLLTEPQAAAISYAGRQRVEAGEAVAVYDFGGGTFDAALVRRTDQGFELIGKPEGMERFGGIDIDAAIMSFVDQSLDGRLGELDESDPAVISGLARLKDDCRAAKEALSGDTDTTINVSLPGIQTSVRLTRSELETMVRPRIIETVHALKRAIASAGLTVDQVSRILLVGGSSRMPLVGQLIQQETGRPIAVDAHPKFAIALGAAALGQTTAFIQSTPPASPLPPLAAAAGAGAAAGALAGAVAGGDPAAAASPPQPPTPPVPPTQPQPVAGGLPPTMPAPMAGAAGGGGPGTPQPPLAGAAAGGGGNGGSSSKRNLMIGGGVGLVVLAVIGFLVFRGGSDKNADPSSTDATDLTTDVTDSPTTVKPKPTTTDSAKPTTTVSSDDELAASIADGVAEGAGITLTAEQKRCVGKGILERFGADRLVEISKKNDITDAEVQTVERVLSNCGVSLTAAGTTTTAAPVTGEQLRAALLVTSDLPQGFVNGSFTDNGDEFCGELPVKQPINHQTVDFDKNLNTPTAESVINTVSVYTSSADAKAVFDQQVRLIGNCPKPQVQLNGTNYTVEGVVTPLQDSQPFRPECKQGALAIQQFRNDATKQVDFSASSAIARCGNVLTLVQFQTLPAVDQNSINQELPAAAVVSVNKVVANIPIQQG